MELNRASANGSPPAELVDISTLTLQELRALLHEHEETSRNALDNALLKKKSAERHYEITRTREAEAQSYLRRYEDAEIVVQELRKSIVDRSKQFLGRQIEPGHVRVPEKRQHSPSPESNMSRRRVAATEPDRTSGVAIKIETPTVQFFRQSGVDQSEYKSLDDANGDEDDEDDEQSNRSSLGARTIHTENPTDQPPNHRLSHDQDTGNNSVLATGFVPRDMANSVQLPRLDALPNEVFAHYKVGHPLRHGNDPSKLKRMVRHDNPGEILIYTNGLYYPGSKCRKPRAGCAILTRTVRDEHDLPECKGFILEKAGPSGTLSDGKPSKDEHHLYNQKRADLRAVLGALERKVWGSEGWQKVTIATRSGYVYKGMTQFLATWKSQGWLAEGHDSHGEVPNADLWARALDLINEQAVHGCEVQFWLVKRDQNEAAEDHARWLARDSDLPVPEAYEPFGNVALTYMSG